MIECTCTFIHVLYQLSLLMFSYAYVLISNLSGFRSLMIEQENKEKEKEKDRQYSNAGGEPETSKYICYFPWITVLVPSMVYLRELKLI